MTDGRRYIRLRVRRRWEVEVRRRQEDSAKSRSTVPSPTPTVMSHFRHSAANITASDVSPLQLPRDSLGTGRGAVDSTVPAVRLLSVISLAHNAYHTLPLGRRMYKIIKEYSMKRNFKNRFAHVGSLSHFLH